MNTRQHMPYEDNYKKASQAYTKLFLTGKPIESLEIFSVKKDGTPVIYETSVTLIKNAQGKAIGFRGVSRDITQRKNMEEALRQSEERYRSIIENMTDGYFEVDLYGNFTYLNDAQCQNLGYTREELIGMSYKKYADEKIGKELAHLFYKIYKTEIPVKSYDLSFIRKKTEPGHTSENFRNSAQKRKGRNHRLPRDSTRYHRTQTNGRISSPVRREDTALLLNRLRTAISKPTCAEILLLSTKRKAAISATPVKNS